MINSEHALHALIEHLAIEFNATANFESRDSGEKLTANFKVSVDPIGNKLNIQSADGEFFRENYPHGFEMLRISNYQQVEIPSSIEKVYAISFSLELLKKPEQIEEEVIEDEDETTLSTSNKAVIAAYLGDDAEEQFASYSDAHKIILNKQMDLLRDLFAISSRVSAK